MISRCLWLHAHRLFGVIIAGFVKPIRTIDVADNLGCRLSRFLPSVISLGFTHQTTQLSAYALSFLLQLISGLLDGFISFSLGLRQIGLGFGAKFLRVCAVVSCLLLNLTYVIAFALQGF